MSVELLIAIFGIIEAVIGFLATIAGNKPKESNNKNDVSLTNNGRDSEFQKFVLSCFLIYVVAGAATAYVGIYSELTGSNAAPWLIFHACWATGTTIIALMIMTRFLRKTSNN